MKTQGEESIKGAFHNVYQSIGLRRNITLKESLPILLTTLRTAIGNLFGDGKIPESVENEIAIEKDIVSESGDQTTLASLQSWALNLYRKAANIAFNRKAA